MNINNGNSTSGFDAWEAAALSELHALQKRVSKALLKFQSNADKAELGVAANRFMDELKATVKRLLKATPTIQDQVDVITDMIYLMAHFSGITFDE